MKSSVYFLAQYADFLLSAGVAMIIFLIIAAAFRLEIVSISPEPIIIILLSAGIRIRGISVNSSMICTGSRPVK